MGYIPKKWGKPGFLIGSLRLDNWEFLQVFSRWALRKIRKVKSHLNVRHREKLSELVGGTNIFLEAEHVSRNRDWNFWWNSQIQASRNFVFFDIGFLDEASPNFRSSFLVQPLPTSFCWGGCSTHQTPRRWHPRQCGLQWWLSCRSPFLQRQFPWLSARLASNGHRAEHEKCYRCYCYVDGTMDSFLSDLKVEGWPDVERMASIPRCSMYGLWGLFTHTLGIIRWNMATFNATCM